MTLDATGLTIKTAVEIEDDILADVKDPSVLGPAAQLGGESPLRQVLSAFAQQAGVLYQLIQAVYEAIDPKSADGDQLDRIAALRAQVREAATYSTGTVTFTGSSPNVIPAGTIVRVPDGPSFVTTELKFMPGPGSVDIPVRASELGPVEADAGTITELVSNEAGVASITNASAVEVGRNLETDAALRRRLAAAAAVVGSASDPAIRARILALADVTQAVVISNRTPYTDSLGIPAHSARVVVWPAPADDAEIFSTIWRRFPAGIRSNGATSGTATNVLGSSMAVAYSVATEVEVHIEVVLTVDATTYGGDDAVTTAVTDAWSDPQIGQSLLLWMLENGVTDDVTGILTIEVRAKRGSAPSASDTANISAALNEVLTIDAVNVDVTVV